MDPLQYSDIEIPDKLYFKIGEVAKIIGVESYVLRYWETEFPQLKPIKSSTNQRLYKKNDVELICQIRDLLYKHKYTIDGARKKIRDFKKDKKTEATPENKQIMMDFVAPIPPQEKHSHKTPIKEVLNEMENFLKKRL